LGPATPEGRGAQRRVFAPPANFTMSIPDRVLRPPSPSEAPAFVDTGYAPIYVKSNARRFHQLGWEFQV
jgi:hypothetical protein